MIATACALLASGALAWAGDPDPHFAWPRLEPLVRTSVFVHGYLHGYEEGFHLADIDLQLARPARDAKQIDKLDHVEGYRPKFGSKQFFEAGYHEGFRVGYGDGIAGRRFRAISQLGELTQLQHPSTDRPSVPFDEGFSAGYGSGQKQGLSDARHDAPFAPRRASCPPSGKANNQQEFCAAYAGGYQLGYSDGFINIAKRPVTEARARHK